MSRLGIALALGGLFVVTGCPDPGAGGETETDSEGATGTDDTGGDTIGDGMDGLDESSDGLDDTTGGVPGNALEPCDPRDEVPCDEGVCSGTGFSGYYCRPTCSNMAAPGDSCGSDDVCLSDGVGDGLACFDVDGCDFVTGDGCGAGEACAVVGLDPVRTACVPNEPGGPGSQCGPAGALACDLGLGCFGTDLDGDDAGGCGGWCVPGDALPAGCSQCIPLTDEIGTCAECSVLAQDCADGEICNPVNELLGGVCVPAGPATTGESCNPFDESMNCELGNLCLEVEEDVSACVETCDPNVGACDTPDSVCVDLGQIVRGAENGLLGLCIEGGTQFCDPESDPTGCAAGDECLGFEAGVGVCGVGCDPTEGDLACTGNAACFPAADGYFNVVPFLEGNGTCGTGCSTDADCGGETCLLTDGLESDGICGTTCTPPGGAECAGGETCVPTPADAGVGACVPMGDACDPTMPGTCPMPAACVTLDGGGESRCMPPCFEQDPNACAGQPALCQVRTGMSFHDGVCVDVGPACDPIAQDCGADLTCDVIGGGGFGGVATVCDDAGAVAEGGDCSAADCAEGLVCLQDTCVTFCDPTGNACVTGTCTDISALFYLDADTYGACL